MDIAHIQVEAGWPNSWAYELHDEFFELFYVGRKISGFAGVEDSYHLVREVVTLFIRDKRGNRMIFRCRASS